MNLLIVIPCYNHNSYIDILLKEIQFSYSNPVLVIDDGSHIPLNISNHKDVTLIKNTHNMGKGYSIIKAAVYAKKKLFTHILTIDSDMQHPTTYIEEFIKIDTTYEFVYGRRVFFKQMPILRSLSNYITSNILSFICNKKIFDTQCGYRRYSLNMFKNVVFKEYGYQFESEILLNKINGNSKVKDINIKTIYNNSSSSMNIFKDTLKFIRCVLRGLVK